MISLPPVPEMIRAYKRSNPEYDGIFLVAVRTTGVFCLPSCGARKPLPANVEYYATPREALFAGYRPCKRCRPMETIGLPPPWVKKVLGSLEQEPLRRMSDSEIRAMGVDPARLRNFFKRRHGMTFQSYCRSRRLASALEQIRMGAPIDDVALGYGYNSHSGFREAFRRTFGAPPGKSRNTEAITLAWIESPLGPLVAGATQDRLVLLEFTERRMLESQFLGLRRLFRCALVPGDNRILSQLRTELSDYFAGRRRSFTVPVAYPGSDFQQRVWRELMRIPFGRTITYRDLAERVGSRRAYRAVGRANGLNRIAIVVPCHRVIHEGGAVGGYGGGVWRKQALLEMERGLRRN